MATKHYHQPRRSNRSKGEPIEMKIVTAILKGLWWLIVLPFKGFGQPKAQGRKSASIDTVEVARRWSEIQTSVNLGGVTHFGAAVMSADKLLDYVLKQKGYSGETMGERLRAAEQDMSPAVYHNAWQAHKLRNQLAHDIDGQVMSFQVKEAIQSYEQALRDLGAMR
jgi:hypothetical protein